MTKINIISPDAALDTLLQRPHQFGFLDVRSESEFADAHICGFVNGPILSDQERHVVGTCYKQQGQQAAYELGYQLTLPHKIQRIKHWASLAIDQTLIVCCWRGGARSRIACEWLAEIGINTLRIEGGYKAMRQQLRNRLEAPPALLVLAGPTGSGKTELLRSLSVPTVDLEGCANHRGSAFGECGVQPTQAQFENDIGLALWQKNKCYVLEDESRLIGKMEIPMPLKQAMYQSPVLIVDVAMDIRVANIFREYVQLPREKGVNLDDIRDKLLSNLARIKNKLGDVRYRQIAQALSTAFSSGIELADAHRAWIEPLLVHYYDSRYAFAFERQPRKILAQGDADYLKQFISAWMLR